MRYLGPTRRAIPRGLLPHEQGGSPPSEPRERARRLAKSALCDNGIGGGLRRWTMKTRPDSTSSWRCSGRSARSLLLVAATPPRRNAPSISQLAHDRQFAAALAAGPVAWIALALALNVRRSRPGSSATRCAPEPRRRLAAPRGGAASAAASSRPCRAPRGARARPGASRPPTSRRACCSPLAHLADADAGMGRGDVRPLARLRPLPRALRLDRPGRGAPRLLQRRIFPPRRAAVRRRREKWRWTQAGRRG